MLFFFPSHILSSPFCSLSPQILTQIRGHIPGPSPLPTTVHALHFLSREDFSSSLVDSRRIVLTHAINRRSQQFFFLGQTPEEGGIPPSDRAPRRYTKVHLDVCPRFSTLIVQMGPVPLCGAGPGRYIRSPLCR